MGLEISLKSCSPSWSKYSIINRQKGRMIMGIALYFIASNFAQSPICSCNTSRMKFFGWCFSLVNPIYVCWYICISVESVILLADCIWIMDELFALFLQAPIFRFTVFMRCLYEIWQTRSWSEWLMLHSSTFYFYVPPKRHYWVGIEQGNISTHSHSDGFYELLPNFKALILFKIQMIYVESWGRDSTELVFLVNANIFDKLIVSYPCSVAKVGQDSRSCGRNSDIQHRNFTLYGPKDMD